MKAFVYRKANKLATNEERSSLLLPSSNANARMWITACYFIVSTKVDIELLQIPFEDDFNDPTR